MNIFHTEQTIIEHFLNTYQLLYTMYVGDSGYKYEVYRPLSPEEISYVTQYRVKPRIFDLNGHSIPVFFTSVEFGYRENSYIIEVRHYIRAPGPGDFYHEYPSLDPALAFLGKKMTSYTVQEDYAKLIRLRQLMHPEEFEDRTQ